MTPAAAAKAVRGTPAAEVTVELWLRAWREFFPGERGEQTVAHDDYMLAPFQRRHARRLLRSITRLEAQEWASAHPSQLRYLRAVFEKARDVGLVDENVWDRARRPRGSGRVILPPSEAQLEDAIWNARGRGGWWAEEFAELVTVAAFTGARLGGLARLRLSDVDLPGRRLTVTEKGGKTRTIALTARAYDALGRRRGALRLSVDRDPLVFRSQLRRPLTRGSVGEAWRAVRGEFDGSFHSLKHFAASWLLEQGLSAEDVAIQLGHVDAAGRPYTRLVKRVYGHPDHDRALARVAEAA